MMILLISIFCGMCLQVIFVKLSIIFTINKCHNVRKDFETSQIQSPICHIFMSSYKSIFFIYFIVNNIERNF